MTITKIDQCTHCLRDDDECSAHPCSEVIEQRSAFEQPYYDANAIGRTAIIATVTPT